jgi:hypothetical protein
MLAGRSAGWSARTARGKEMALPPMQNPEYLVVLEVVRRARGRERERMYSALRDRSRAEIDAAIMSLEHAGLVAAEGARVHASPALRRLNELGLIGV